MLDFADPKFTGWRGSEILNLETKLNELWVARCKANDALLEFCETLIHRGYKFEFSPEPDKQFKITKGKVEIHITDLQN